MILRRLILALAAAAVLVASASVCVVALAFALYGLLAPRVGVAGASVIVAGASAVLVAIGAMTLLVVARPSRSKAPPPAPIGIAEVVTAFLRDKPVVAVVGALATGFLAIRNPGYLGAAFRAFVEGRERRRP